MLLLLLSSLSNNWLTKQARQPETITAGTLLSIFHFPSKLKLAIERPLQVSQVEKVEIMDWIIMHFGPPLVVLEFDYLLLLLVCSGKALFTPLRPGQVLEAKRTSEASSLFQPLNIGPLCWLRNESTLKCARATNLHKSNYADLITRTITLYRHQYRSCDKRVATFHCAALHLNMRINLNWIIIFIAAQQKRDVESETRWDETKRHFYGHSNKLRSSSSLTL